MGIGAPLHDLDTRNNGTQTVYSFDYDLLIHVRVMLLPESLPPTAPLFFALADPDLPHRSASDDPARSDNFKFSGSGPLILNFVFRAKKHGRLGIHGATHGGTHELDED